MTELAVQRVTYDALHRQNAAMAELAVLRATSDALHRQNARGRPGMVVWPLPLTEAITSVIRRRSPATSADETTVTPI